MAMVEIRNLRKYFGDVRAVDDVSLDVIDGEMLCLLGPSGCGKTTLLRLLSGFIQADAGTIVMDGRDVSKLTPEKRPTSMVFQSYALFPHLNVFDNIAFGLKIKKLSMKEIQSKVSEMLLIVGLEGLGARSIRQLSGGQQQRVALGRALIMEPKVLLLDEPLSNLDAKLRVETREQIRKIQQSVNITSIFVTHDQEEALTMADRVAVMRNGKIEQLDDPRTIYHFPENGFVAAFIGKSNFLKGTYNSVDDTFELAKGMLIKVPKPHTPIESSDADFVLRPEYILLNAALPSTNTNDFNVLSGTVGSVTFLGEITIYEIIIDLDENITMQVHVYRLIHEYKIGERVTISWSVEDGLVL